LRDGTFVKLGAHNAHIIRNTTNFIMHNVQFISVGGSRRRDGGRGADGGGEEGDARYDGRGEERSDAMRRSSVLRRIKIFSLSSQTIKQMPRANSRSYTPAGVTILGPTIMSLINNLLRRDAILLYCQSIKISARSDRRAPFESWSNERVEECRPNRRIANLHHK